MIFLQDFHFLLLIHQVFEIGFLQDVDLKGFFQELYQSKRALVSLLVMILLMFEVREDLLLTYLALLEEGGTYFFVKGYIETYFVTTLRLSLIQAARLSFHLD